MTTLPAKPSGPLLAALRTGSADRILDEALSGFDINQLPAHVAAGARQLAQLVVDLRRQDVAVLGSHEAFVRHTPSGSLYQVIRPVHLSLADGTIYQMTSRRPYWKNADGSPGNRYNGRVRESDRGKVIWVEEAAEAGRAMLQFAGYVRMNAVAGCAVSNPRTVFVDGQERVNPYIERAATKSGRLGDIVRIVVAVTIAGPAPATGNPVVLTYTLDYDPAKDLQAMLAEVASKHSDHCYLIDEEEWYESPRAGWKFLPLYGGVGWAHDLRMSDVRDVYQKFTNILANAPKKAWTVAQRNAMRSHPALGGHAKVEVDANGRAVVPVIGWAGDDRAMQRWQRLLDALARGEAIESVELDGADIEYTEVAERYDPEAPDTAGVDVEPDMMRREVIDHEDVEEPDEERLERERRVRLIRQIDDGLQLCSPDYVAELDYRPDEQSAEELGELLAQLNAHLDDTAADAE